MSLRSSLPWTKSPLIINAPMGGFAGGDLATAVTKAGGLGLIGATNDMDAMKSALAKAGESLQRHNELLPIGVGIIVFISKIDETISILEEHKPAVVWLFAAKELEDYGTWASKLRDTLPKSQIWIQVGSVEAALKVAELANPDVLCAQGADAGGHGFEMGAGVISLVPEISDALAERGHSNISLVASGGIADGRSAAAVLALGAQGAVVGTRFLTAPETQVHPIYQKAIVAASDGGQTTVRSKLFDELRGPNMWPGPYDGRSIVVESFRDHRNGVGIDEIRKLHNEAVKADDAGFEEHGKGRAAIWAGTGVGFAKRVQPAAEIVEDIRSGAVKALEAVRPKI